MTEQQEAQAQALIRSWASGPLQGLQLRLWRWSPADITCSGRTSARLIGSYRVREAGAAHRVPIDERADEFTGFGPWTEAAGLMARAEHDPLAAEQLAVRLLDQALR